jgi:hypothetical protein
MIEIIPSRKGNKKSKIHPDWSGWMEACAYRSEEARRELGMANGTFYRQIQREPDLVTRLAMAALYEALTPWNDKDYP